MGQKSHPYSLRLGYIRTWHSRWFSRKDYSNLLIEDMKLRKFIKEKLGFAGISRIEIERSSGKARIIIHTARPGIIIGRRGQEIEKVKDGLADITKAEVAIDIKEVKLPQVNAQLVAESIAQQLEKRVSFRKAMKRAMQLAMQHTAKGIRIVIKGRVGGAEIARQESAKQGSVPLGTFRADVDYGFTEAKTTYGTIGVKVWIYTGDILVGREEKKKPLPEEEKGLETVGKSPASEEAVSPEPLPENKGETASGRNA